MFQSPLERRTFRCLPQHAADETQKCQRIKRVCEQCQSFRVEIGQRDDGHFVDEIFDCVWRFGAGWLWFFDELKVNHLFSFVRSVGKLLRSVKV